MKKEVVSRPRLSIVIPAFNEEKRIGKTLKTLSDFLRTDKYFKSMHVEVLVVAADTTDKTKGIVRKKMKLFKDITLLEPGPEVGKGRDVQYGMLRASGNYIIFMDADLATPLHHLTEFYEACQSSDLVIGVRNFSKYKGSRIRGVVTMAANTLYRISGGVRVKDTQCGFKMFTQDAVQLCFSKVTITGWNFDMEILAIARSNKLSIRTIKINDWQDMPYSTYTDKFVRIGIRMFLDHINIVRNVILRKYH